MTLKHFVWAAIIALAIFGAYATLRSLGYELDKKEKNNRYFPIEEVRKDMLDLWLDRLADFECQNCPDNFRHLDKNNLYSYGCLQFQKNTFYAEVRRYKLLPFTEDAELMNWIYDCQFQKSLARYMIQAGGFASARSHWYTSVVLRGLGYPPVPEN